MKAFILSIALLFCALIGSANTIYEIKYKFQDATEYTAFMVRYDNKTGFIRVKYYNTKKQYRVVNMDFVEEESKRDINGVLYDALRFVGKNPSFILGSDEETEAYNPDYIWFCKLPSQKDYKPWGVTSPDADGSVTQGTIISVKILNTSELTESYVHSFFRSDEAFYINLFNKPTAILTSNKPNTPPTKPNTNPYKPNTTSTTQTTTGASLKLIMVANTLDARIGVTCQLDIDRVKKTFRDIAVALNLNFVYTEVKGVAFNKTNLLNAVNNVTSKNSDIIVFCYTGHGYHFENDMQNPYPQMDMRTSPKQDAATNTVNVTEVYGKLKTQSAHLKLILTDCCNTILDEQKMFSKPFASTMRSNIQWSKSNCENLFLRQSGVVVASAASIGEIARCNLEYGGYFLFNFLKSLDKSLSVFGSSQSWDNIISETRETVLNMSRMQECEAKVCTQTAVSYVTVK
ncbi:caspase family protein [Pedobacter frigiditerrae]|uniref:caspase family protein n=1 Tax=Pedobacter frigiditerrae TaxID=2530452 RepID=UPI0029306589|nr:caspase family protein [Pedobacter frigiditerrae]